VAVRGWVLDNSAASQRDDPVIATQLAELAGLLYICPVGELEQLYPARSAQDYDTRNAFLHESFEPVNVPPDIFDRALRLQRDLAHHHGMWHRIPFPDLLNAVTDLFHDLGVVDVDGDFNRIAEVRPLVARRLG
jgi:predicted nucleic acid-binding protein